MLWRSVSSMPRARFAEILGLLVDNDVEFVVVGRTAGILHGAPVTTVDLDIDMTRPGLPRNDRRRSWAPKAARPDAGPAGCLDADAGSREPASGGSVAG